MNAEELRRSGNPQGAIDLCRQSETYSFDVEAAPAVHDGTADAPPAGPAARSTPVGTRLESWLSRVEELRAAV